MKLSNYGNIHHSLLICNGLSLKIAILKKNLVREIKSRRPYSKLVQTDWWEETKHLIYREAEIDKSDLDEWLSKAIMFSPFPFIPLVGYDGVYYGFKIGDSENHFSLTSWSDWYCQFINCKQP